MAPVRVSSGGVGHRAHLKPHAGLRLQHADDAEQIIREAEMKARDDAFRRREELTREMETLRAATGAQFDHLFLTGMIQHHTGALTMLDDLFDTPGAAQDMQLFDFTADIGVTQQGEIDAMRNMLPEKKYAKEK